MRLRRATAATASAVAVLIVLSLVGTGLRFPPPDGLRFGTAGEAATALEDGAVAPPPAGVGALAIPEPDGDPTVTGGKTLSLSPHSSEQFVNGLDYVEHTTTVGWSCSYESQCKVAGLDFAIDVWSGGVVTDSGWSLAGLDLPTGSLLPFPVIPGLDTQGVVPIPGIVWAFPVLVGGTGSGAPSQLAALEGVASGTIPGGEYAASMLPHYLDMLRGQDGYRTLGASLRSWAERLRAEGLGREKLDEVRAAFVEKGWPTEFLDTLDTGPLPSGEELAESMMSGVATGMLAGPAYHGLQKATAALRERGPLDQVWNPLLFARAMDAYRGALGSSDPSRLADVGKAMRGMFPSEGRPTPRDFQRVLERLAQDGEPPLGDGIRPLGHGEIPLDPVQLGLGMVCIFCGGVAFLGGLIGHGLAWHYRSIAFPGPPPHLGSYGESAPSTRTVFGLQLPFPDVVSLVFSFVGLASSFLPLPIAVPPEVFAFLTVYSVTALLLQELLGPETFQKHCGGQSLPGFLPLPVGFCIYATAQSITIELDPIALPVLFFGMKDPLAAVTATGKELRIRFVLLNVGFERGRADVFETVETASPNDWGPLPYTGKTYEIDSLFFGPGPGVIVEEYRTESPVLDEAGLFVLHTHLESYDLDEHGPEMPNDTASNNAHELLHDQPLWDAFTFLVAKRHDLIVWTEQSPNDALRETRKEARANKALDDNLPTAGCAGKGAEAAENAVRTSCGADLDPVEDAAAAAAKAAFTELAATAVGARDAIYTMADSLRGVPPGTTEDDVEHNPFVDLDLGEEITEGGETGASVAGSVDSVYDTVNLPAAYDDLSPTQKRVREIFGDRKGANGDVGFRVHEVYDAEMLVNLEFELLERATEGLLAAVDDLGEIPFDDLVHGKVTLSDEALDLLGESLLGSSVLVMAPAPGAGATVTRPQDPAAPVVPADFLLNLLHAAGIQGFVADGAGADWLAFRNPLDDMEFVPYGGMFVGAEASEDPAGQIASSLTKPVAQVTFDEFHELVLPAGNSLAVPEGSSLGKFLRDYNGALSSPDDSHPSTLHQIADLAATGALGLRYTARNSGNDTEAATNLGWTETALLLEAFISAGPKAFQAKEAADGAAAGDVGAVEAFVSDEGNTRVTKRSAGSRAIGASCLEFKPDPLDAGIGVLLPLVTDARAVIVAPPALTVGGDWDTAMLEIVQDSGSGVSTGIVDPLYEGLIKPFLEAFLGALPDAPAVPPVVTGVFDPFMCP